MRLLSLILIFVALPSGAIAKSRHFEIYPVTTSPKIDGKLEDEIWKAIPSISNFRQVEPYENNTPSEPTEVRIAFDKNTIFIGVRCYDSDPDAIIARELRNDASLHSDDRISIMFDTFLDRRNAFLFEVNPLGTKSEARLENNQNLRSQWQGIWHAASKIDDKGWTAEIAIPVNTLTFDPALTEWGLEIQRFIRHRNETIRWANISQDHDIRYVAAYGKLGGLEGLSQGKGLEVVTAIASQFSFDKNTNDRQLITKPGGELIYKFSPSVTTSILVNPDFSDTAVDESRSNLSRF